MNIKPGHKMMTVLSSLIVFTLFAAFHIEAIALEKPLPISFSHLSSPNKEENSALSGECNGDTSSMEIGCYFVQTRISIKLDPKKLPEKIRELQTELEKQKKDLKSLYKSFCSDLTDKTKIDQVNQKLNELEYSAPQSYTRMREMLSICSNTSYDKILNFTKKIIEDETRTCKISSFTDYKTLHLKKIGPNKWLGTEWPSGLCNSVITYTLEHEPNYNTLWTYTQIRSHTDQNELCKGFEVGKPLIYSWKNKPIEMKCDFIEFGW